MVSGGRNVILPIKDNDFVRVFRLDKTHIRGRHVRLEKSVNHILNRHRYPKLVSLLLGDLLSLGVILSSTVKYDGIFTVQTNSSGPLRFMIADIASTGEIRGYANFAQKEIEEYQECINDVGIVPQIMGSGHLTFTVNQAKTDNMYQGIVPLEGRTISECAHNYFKQSEQISTAIKIATEQVATSWKSSALMLQREPISDRYESREELLSETGKENIALEVFETNEDWHIASILMGSATKDELTNYDLDSNTLLYKLFHEESVRVYEPKALKFGCHCSRDRVIKTLRGLPKKEISSLQINGKVLVKCEFCDQSESFTENQLDTVYGP